jgi:hypothetical protein
MTLSLVTGLRLSNAKPGNVCSHRTSCTSSARAVASRLAAALLLLPDVPLPLLVVMARKKSPSWLISYRSFLAIVVVTVMVSEGRSNVQPRGAPGGARASDAKSRC